jgi:acyl-CoA synthetase (AMP-forming)/AMP-acid ligase II
MKTIRNTGVTMAAYVLGLPDSERGQIVAAVVVTPDGASLDVARLREELEAELSSYKVPRRFLAVAAADIPLMSSGKVDIRRLAELFDA